MARVVAMVGTLVVLLHATPTVESSDPDPNGQVATLAAEAGVDEQDLRGAMNTTGLTARDYLRMTGELQPPPPVSSASRLSASFNASAALTARVACIEAKESGGNNTWNSRGSGAGGVLQYMPSTFARGARELGHPEWSLWNPAQARLVAAHDLAMGRRGQWTVSGC
jgi:hypothetical protein